METDILVVGDGGAGLVAACAARAGGAKVTLVTKSRAGWGNPTVYAGADFAMRQMSRRWNIPYPN